jgi:hypothetical protein
MKSILEKISSYNIFNYLLPGILFVIITKYVTTYNFVQSDIILGIFLYYFIGLIISRLGSTIIDPILKLTKFIREKPYKEYVESSRQDEKIILFTEYSKMYRTLCAMAISVLVLKLYEYCVAKFQICDMITQILLLILILVLFLFSYKKQTSYIKKRMEIHTEKNI